MCARGWRAYLGAERLQRLCGRRPAWIAFMPPPTNDQSGRVAGGGARRGIWYTHRPAGPTRAWRRVRMGLGKTGPVTILSREVRVCGLCVWRGVAADRMIEFLRVGKSHLAFIENITCTLCTDATAV
eukprot:2882115-Prymnesium_polylepis.1